MTNLSSLSKAFVLQLFALSLSAGAVIDEFIISGSAPIGSVALCCSLLAIMCGASYFQIVTYRSILRFTKVANKLARGEFENRITRISEKGEIRDIAIAINRIADTTDAFTREACNSMEAVAAGRYFRKVIEIGMSGLFLRSARAINAVTKAMEIRIGKFKITSDQFEHNVGGIIQSVSSAASGLQSSAEAMLSIAEAASKYADVTTNTAAQASRNVATVTANVEQLLEAISVIEEQVTQSAAIAAKAHSEMVTTDNQAKELSVAAEKVGNIVDFIQKIAAQINLLALNATVEAVRAGESGRGFGVVANEVKMLANQTARATNRIADHITNIQTAVDEVVVVIQSVAATVKEMNSISSHIKSLVGRQRGAAREISGIVGQASASSVDVSNNIEDSYRAVLDTRAASAEVFAAATNLEQQSAVLHNEAEKFLAAVRAS